MVVAARRSRPAGLDVAVRTGGAGTGAWRVARRIGTASRLASLYAVILAALLAGSLAVLLHTTTVGVQQIASRQLDAELLAFQSAGLTRPAGQTLQQFATAYLHSHAVPDGDLIEIAQPGAWAVANAGGSYLTDASAIESLAASVPSRTRLASERVAGHQLEVLSAPIQLGGRRSGLFLAAVDITPLKPAGDNAAHLAILVGAVALVAGVGAAYLVLRRLLRRIGRIADTADRIGRDRIEDRLGDQGTNDEVGQLANSFDSMLDRIGEAVQAQHELLSDVSHQLRTPLTVARGHLELLGRAGGHDAEIAETVDTAIAELDRMAGLVDRLLILGRAREPVRYDVHDVDLRTFLADLVRDGTVLAPRNWELGPAPDALARFDETEVRGALLNLIDNAVNATQPTDTIRISAFLAGSDVELRVDDSGPGIPPAERLQVLDRFSRPATSTDGTGLGLAIASAVCEAHAGELTIADSPLGGASVSMRIRGLAGVDRADAWPRDRREADR